MGVQVAELRARLAEIRSTAAPGIRMERESVGLFARLEGLDGAGQRATIDGRPTGGIVFIVVTYIFIFSFR